MDIEGDFLNASHIIIQYWLYVMFYVSIARTSEKFTLFRYIKAVSMKVSDYNNERKEQ